MTGRRYLAVLAGLTAVYYAAGRFGLALAFVHQSASAVWPPTGIALAALLLMGARVWPAILAGAFLVNLATAGSIVASIGIAAGNTLEGLAGAYLVNRFAGGRHTFERPQYVLRFAFFAGVVSTIISASCGVASLLASGLARWDASGSIWLTWWLGDMVGDFVIAPLLILWGENPRPEWSRSQSLEAVLLFLSLLVVGAAVFTDVFALGTRRDPLEFLCIPTLLWAAFRFGPREAASASVVLSAVAIRGTIRGFGPFVSQSPNDSILLLQTFMGAATVMAIAVAVVVQQRRKDSDMSDRLRNRIDTIIATVPGVVWEAWGRPDEPSQQINFVSDYVETMLGYTVAQWLASPNFWLSIVHPEDREQAAQEAAAIFKGGKGGVSRFRWVAKDGRVVWVESRSVVIYNQSGLPIGTRGVTMDITDLRRAEEERAGLLAAEQEARQEAEAANHAKDEFLATVSHELRTPLTAILGWARIVRSGTLGWKEQVMGLETIERNAKAQAHLIDDILDVSRIITGKLNLQIRPVELASVVTSAVENLHPAAEANDIRLQCRLDSDTGPVRGDPDRLQQVVWNLLSNAIKFTPRGGRVQVSLRRVGPQAELSVSDTGQGIQPDFLPHVFDRFRQADSSSSRTHGGLGLGLAIVRHIVELHGGKVYAESPGEGLGSTFIVLLPLIYTSVLEAAGRAPLKQLDCPPVLAGRNVLVVDDEPDTRMLLAAVLGRCGINVTTAATVPEALEILRTSRQDILVSDIGMPEEDGYVLIHKVRALDPDIPAIALTGYARTEDRMQVLSAGYQMHVPKPVEPAELLAVLASVAQRVTKR